MIRQIEIDHVRGTIAQCIRELPPASCRFAGLVWPHNSRGDTPSADAVTRTMGAVHLALAQAARDAALQLAQLALTLLRSPPEEIDVNELLRVLTEADLLTLRACESQSAGFLKPKVQAKSLTITGAAS